MLYRYAQNVLRVTGRHWTDPGVYGCFGNLPSRGKSYDNWILKAKEWAREVVFSFVRWVVNTYYRGQRNNKFRDLGGDFSFCMGQINSKCA